MLPGSFLSAHLSAPDRTLTEALCVDDHIIHAKLDRLARARSEHLAAKGGLVPRMTEGARLLRGSLAQITEAGIAESKKNRVENASRHVGLGAEVDGDTTAAPASRRPYLTSATLQIVQARRCPVRRLAQVISQWTSFLLCRRSLLSIFSKVYEVLHYEMSLIVTLDASVREFTLASVLGLVAVADFPAFRGNSGQSTPTRGRMQQPAPSPTRSRTCVMATWRT